jgi:hypothetical protein
MLQVDAHGELALQDLGFVAAMLARPAGEEGRGPTERVAARPLDMDDLGAELRQFRADERLRDENARANRTKSLKRPKLGDTAGVAGRCKFLIQSGTVFRSSSI